MQPLEVGISAHQAENSEVINGKVSQEMFDGIIREVVEEIGVPAHSLVELLKFLFTLLMDRKCY